MRTCMIVGIGGFIGTICRYLLTLLPYTNKSGFPLFTLLINVAGAFVIGVIAALAAKYHGINTDLMAFLRVGVCGGFTTFSTFALEITGLWSNGRPWIGIAYIVLSLLFSLLAVSLEKTLIS